MVEILLKFGENHNPGLLECEQQLSVLKKMSQMIDDHPMKDAITIELREFRDREGDNLLEAVTNDTEERIKNLRSNLAKNDMMKGIDNL